MQMTTRQFVCTDCMDKFHCMAKFLSKFSNPCINNTRLVFSLQGENYKYETILVASIYQAWVENHKAGVQQELSHCRTFMKGHIV